MAAPWHDGTIPPLTYEKHNTANEEGGDRGCIPS